MMPLKFIHYLMNKHGRRYVMMSCIWSALLMILIPLYHYIQISCSLKIMIATVICIVVSILINVIYTKNDIKDMVKAHEEIMKENHELATALYENKLYVKNDIAPIVLSMAMVAEEKSEDD